MKKFVCFVLVFVAVVQTSLVAADNGFESNFVYCSSSQTTWDESLGVFAYSTVYYTIKQDNSPWPPVLITRVEGGWVVKDPAMRLSNREVKTGCVGLDSNLRSVSDVQINYPEENTFDYTTNFSNYIIQGATKATSCVTIQLSGTDDTWVLEHTIF